MSVLYLKNNQGIWEEVSTINGHTPVITASKSNGITTIYADGTTVATINDGEKGEKGEDGETPLSAFPNDTVSGQIVHITDGADDIPMDSVKVKIEPVQDLHGQNNPYPAGGGKNILDLEAYIASRTSNYTVDSDGWITFNPALASVYANKWVVGDLKTRSAILLIDTATQLDGVKLRVYNGDTVVAATPSGNPSSSKIENREFDRISFDWTTSSDNTKTIKVKVAIVDEATIDAWSPYSNICPISGWTGCEVVRTGVNIWDEEWEEGSINNNTGLPSPDPNNIRAKNYCSCKPNTTYFILSGSEENTRFYWYDAEKNFIFTDFGKNVVKTSPENARYFKVRTTGTYGGTYNNDVSINYPSTDHDYHPYTGDTYSITFPSEADTVYGGTLNVTNGTLTVNRAMVDLGTLNWSAYTLASNCFKAVLSDGKATRTNYSADGACSSYAKADYITTLRDTDKTFGIGYTHLSANVCYVAVHDSSYSDATAFKTAMNGVQLCYELATPITYTLTPTEIKSLYGENNIYADCGSTSVTYRADTTSYIGKIITATKSGTVTTVYVKDKPIATINDGTNGKDYTLTTQDKADIAQQVINILPTAQGVSF